MIPYGKQSIDDDDIEAVVSVLRSDWLTTGPAVEAFESSFAKYVGVSHAVAFCNGTAALHALCFACDLGKGDEVITTPLSFVATANAIVYTGATPVFVDIDPNTLLLDPKKIEKRITPQTKAVLTVDYAGQPSYYSELQSICDKHGILLLADACHAVGAEYNENKVGSLAAMSAFSFHPVKHITTGEGGMVTTDSLELKNKLKQFRNHGIATDFKEREKSGVWEYDMKSLGYNYRITDLQCALGMTQLKKLDVWITKRNQIAEKYNEAFAKCSDIEVIEQLDSIVNAYHLFVIKVKKEKRNRLITELREKGIGVNVHYKPIYLHTYYKDTLQIKGNCPVAESVYDEIISIPIFPLLTEAEQDFILSTIIQLCE
ncbi:MAG: UDP-4-amino-4,6-dideoxy-N-acetyl-beta-L-altrosamine transaminase [Fibrobacterales bacterium]